jgi:hypothetical protein
VQIGACTSTGPENCILISNTGQENDDTASQGNACQCGEVIRADGLITEADLEAARRHVVSGTPAFVDASRCNVVGLEDGGASDCTVADLAIIDRIAQGSNATVGNACSAFRP